MGKIQLHQNPWPHLNHNTLFFLVLGIAREPIVGWVHNAQGALRMITGTMLGVIRAGYHDDDKIVDLIPVDFVANVIIASAWDMVTR